jgi:D-sedoheptulose 7-phosphate isomerase
MNDYYSNYFLSISKGLESSQYFHLANIVTPSKMFTDLNREIDQIRNNSGKIYFFGNGASAAFANHMALDFSKNGKIIARSLSDSSMLTALANDYSYTEAMVEFLKIEELNKNDLVVTISSSGNSPNIVNVLKYCKDNNFKTLSLSGLKKDNKSIQLSDYSIYVPMKTYGMVECIHQIFLHLILDQSMNIFEWDRVDFQNMNINDFNI